MGKNMEIKIGQAFSFFDQGELETAEQLYKECLQEVTDKSSDQYKTILHGLGFVKSHMKKFDQARMLYKQLLSLADNNKHEAHVVIHQLGMVERMAGNYDQATRYFKEELTILDTYISSFMTGYAANYYEQGYILYKQTEYERSEMFMQKSLRYANKSGDYIAIGCAHRGLGRIYEAIDDRERALFHLSQARDHFDKANDLNAVKEIEQLMTNVKHDE